jgi:hypothetical protein
MKKKIKFILIGFLSLTTFSTITTTSTSCSKYTNPFETLVPGTNFTISENQIDEFRKASYNMFFGTAPFSIANPFDELCSGASTQADSTNDSICAY